MVNLYWILVYLRFSTGLWLRIWCLTPLSIISVISWRSVLLMEEAGVPGENH